MTTPPALKYGDVRTDGYIFQKIKTNGNELWLSPSAWHNSCLRRTFETVKKRAKLSGIPFDLTINHLREIYPADGRCPVFGAPMSWGQKDGRDCSPSLDRVAPEKGYTIGNVVFISHRANRIKSDATLEELERVTNYLRNCT